jgi:putative aldouronate transport system substrate-binding protein
MSQGHAHAGGKVSRRRFIEYAGWGVMGAAALPLLAACAPTTPVTPASTTTASRPTAASTSAGAAAQAAQAASTPVTSGSTIGGVRLPTYIPFAEGPKPDLPGSIEGVDPAYFRFPSQLVKTVPQAPGDGSDVSAIVVVTYAAPVPMERNATWQAINKAIGSTIKLDMVPTADFPARLNVVLAGSEIPDFIYNLNSSNPQGVIPSLPQFLRSRCADLTPYLSGDAIKDYPNLAHFSTYTWRSSVADGKIYGIPSSRPPINGLMMFRSDLFEKAGVPLDKAPKDAAEFKRMLQAVTRPQDNQYGLATTAQSYFGLTPGSTLPGVFHAPNNWSLDASGKLVKDWETEEFAAAVGYVRDLWAAGVYHPDTPTYAGILNNDFIAGRHGVVLGVWGQYVQNYDNLLRTNPNGRVAPMHPFAHDGGKPTFPAGSGNFGLTYIKQQPSPERVKMLLRVANFFAAPFGSEEWLLNYFGPKDVAHTINAEGAPVQTEQGQAELTATWRYISSPAYALFSAYRSQEFANLSHAAELAMVDALQLDPTQALYSPTAFGQGVLAQDTFFAGVTDIVLGRRPIGDLGGIVSEWRGKVGDKMRGEFQEALEAAKR